MYVSVEDLEKAWIAGRKAFLAGEAYKSNPFDLEKEKKLFNEWADGWYEANAKYTYDI
jgi:ribosome modulation factor